MAYDLKRLFELVDKELLMFPHLTLKEISARAGVERHTIEKAVKLNGGLSFRELRNKYRLDRTKRLLQESATLTIKEISFKVGYRSQRSFSRFVRTMAGDSPKGLRGLGQRSCHCERPIGEPSGKCES